MSNIKRFFVLPLAGAGCAFLLLANAACAAPYQALKENVFRLHVIANSDAQSDQALKLAVRDALLPVAKEYFEQIDVEQYPGSTNAQKTASAACAMTDLFNKVAKQTVTEHGCAQEVDVKVGYAHFPTKQYEDLTMPAGNYWCLRVVLGEGSGQNWWCVLYPPLCLLPASEQAYFDKAELELLHKAEKYRFRLYFLDLYEQWKIKMKSA